MPKNLKIASNHAPKRDFWKAWSFFLARRSCFSAMAPASMRRSVTLRSSSLRAASGAAEIAVAEAVVDPESFAGWPGAPAVPHRVRRAAGFGGHDRTVVVPTRGQQRSEHNTI